LILLLDSVLFSLVLENFDDEDLVWLDDGAQEHFVIDELLSIFLPMLLFEDVCVYFYEGANLIGPDVGTIVVRWQQNTHILVETSGLLVVNNYQEFILVSIFLIRNWTIYNSVILADSLARLQVFAFDSCLGCN